MINERVNHVMRINGLINCILKITFMDLGLKMEIEFDNESATLQ